MEDDVNVIFLGEERLQENSYFLKIGRTDGVNESEGNWAVFCSQYSGKSEKYPKCYGSADETWVNV